MIVQVKTTKLVWPKTPDRFDIGLLYEANFPAACRLAYLLTGNAEQAHDLAQEAFIRASARIPALRDRRAFPDYLRKTVINLAIGWRRSSLREVRRVDKIARLPIHVVSEASAAARRIDLWRAIQRLPSRQRAVVVLKYYEDLSESAVSDALNCSPAAVKSLNTRALRALRESVEVDTDE